MRALDPASRLIVNCSYDAITITICLQKGVPKKPLLLRKDRVLNQFPGRSLLVRAKSREIPHPHQVVKVKGDPYVVTS